MRILLSTIGSRGDVQPLVALGLQLKALDQEVHLCVPPDFCAWIEELGLSATPIGPVLRPTGKTNPMGNMIPTPEQRRQMMEGTVTAQFETITAAAEGCDLIVGATVLQIAAPSIAEQMGIPYIFTAICPAVLPSTYHAPPILAALGDKPSNDPEEYPALWAKEVARWDMMWGDLLNAQRTKRGLSTVHEVLHHILTDQPWLAADPALAPWPDPTDDVYQPGAWLVPDDRPLSPELEAFLDAGEPPVYFGFGSIRAPQGLNEAMIQSARALGRRTILLQGWADLSLLDDAPDCLSIGEVNQQALFKRVAAVVHHGGAGTTTAAALSGAPQVIIPQHYDQHFWAGRAHELGIGTAHAPGAPTAESLTRALQHTFQPDVVERAQALAPKVRRNGAEIAAQRLIQQMS